jgi:hypothetical protein
MLINYCFVIFSMFIVKSATTTTSPSLSLKILRPFSLNLFSCFSGSLYVTPSGKLAKNSGG